MTETTTVTCRSVCERLLRWDQCKLGVSVLAEVLSDARLALAQPDDLREAIDAKDARLDESKRLASEWQKRAEEAEAKLRELEESTPKLLKQWSENAQSHRRQLEFLAGWLLDRLVEGRAV